MYQGALQLITPPAVEPVVLADAKLFLRLDTAADDAMVTALIVAARRRVEAITAHVRCNHRPREADRNSFRDVKQEEREPPAIACCE